MTKDILSDLNAKIEDKLVDHGTPGGHGRRNIINENESRLIAFACDNSINFFPL